MDLEKIRQEFEQLKIKLAETQETLDAIQNGSVDALVVNSPDGSKVFTLQTADYPYRVIIENMSEGAATLSPDLEIIYCNRRLSEMLELPFQKIVGKPVESIIYPDDLESFESIVRNGKERPQNGELRITGQKGKQVPVLISCIPLDFENTFVCLIFVDLTEVKKIQAQLKSINENLDALVLQRTTELLASNTALKENQVILKTIINSTPDWITMKDLNGKYFIVNSSINSALFPPLSPDQENITIDDLVSPEEAKVFKAKDDLVLRDKKSVAYDQSIVIKGQNRIFSSIKSPCLDADGKVTGIATISRDITERKMAENALRESEERLRALITATSDVVFRADPSFNDVFYFDSWGAFTRIEKTVNNWFSSIPVRIKTQAKKIFRDAVRQKSILELEHPFLIPEKGVRWMFTRAIPILNENKEIVEWFGTSSDITLRKISEEALRDSERRYSSLFSNKLNAIAHCKMILDKTNKPIDFLFLQVNEAYQDLIGFRKSDLEGHRIKEFFPDLDRCAFDYIAVFGDVASQNKEIRFEEYFEPTRQYFSIYAYSPMPGEFIAFVSDITERTLTEKALLESERKFSVMFQSTPVGIALSTINDGILYDVNSAWLDLFGFSAKEEVIGKSSVGLGIIPLMGYHEQNKEADQYQRVRNHEQVFLDKKGSTHYLLINTDLIEINAEKFLLSSFEDITDRKSMEDALRESRQRWVTTLASIGDAVISTDTEGRITFMNPEAEKLTGWNHRETKNKPVDQFLKIKDGMTSLPLEYDEIPDVKIAGLSDDRILINKEGEEIPVDYSRAPIITKDGRKLGIVSIFRDISKRKEAEEVIRNYNSILEQTVKERTAELISAKERAESADKLKTAFLLNISHELRTPLNSIIGFSGILLRQLAGPVNSEQEKQLAMVQKSGRHLLSLINDILDISRIEAGELIPVYESIDLSDIIQDVLQLIEPQIKAKGLTIQFEQTSPVCSLSCDKIRIRQVLINIIYNAVKFTAQGGIVIRCSTHQDQVKVEISDTGIGIKQEDLDKLFNPFIQLENNLTRRFEGSGLGLSISKKIMDLLGGKIEVSSEYGCGSTFTISIPVR